MYAVASDHDYLKGHPEDRWLEQNSISTIIESDIVSIDEKTTGQSKNKSWQQERGFRLQASNCGGIRKATVKINFKHLAEFLAVCNNLKTATILHGKKYEAVALSKYENEKGLSTKQSGIRVSKIYSCICSSRWSSVYKDISVYC